MKREVFSIKTKDYISKILSQEYKCIKIDENKEIVVDDSFLTVQRGVIYSIGQQQSVITTILRDGNIPAITLFKANDSDALEIIDGKQRTASLINYYNNKIMLEDGSIYKGLSDENRYTFDNYTLFITFLQGNDDEKRTTFYRLNRSSEPLKDYEVLNGAFHGTTWLSTFTKYIESDYKDLIESVYGTSNKRGEKYWSVLELLRDLYWEPQYKTSMAINHGANTGEWLPVDKTSYTIIHDKVNSIQSKISDFEIGKVVHILTILTKIFDKKRYKKVYALEWVKDNENIQTLELDKLKVRKQFIERAIVNYENSLDDLPKSQQPTKEAIKLYIYSIIDTIKNTPTDILEHTLPSVVLDPIRLFTPEQRHTLFINAKLENGRFKCPKCKQLFYENELEVNHKKAWSKGGKTILENAELLCKSCNASTGTM